MSNCNIDFSFMFQYYFPVNLCSEDIVKYKGHLERSRFLLLNAHGDTVLNPDGDYYLNFTYRDFNQDGNKDILLEMSGNPSDKYELFLYSPNSRSFKKVKGFENFGSPKPIEGTYYYYSYSRSGCADETWISYLFFIEHYEAVKLGCINGEGCGIKDGIYIYRQRGSKKLMIETLPLKTIEQYKEYKWGFIKSYWTKHYRKFL